MKQILDIQIFEVGDYSLKLHNVILFGLFVGVIILLLMVLKRVIYRSNKLDPAKKFAVNKLSRYVIAAFAVVISLNILGFNVSVLLAGSAALLVGLGFGLQSLFSDFISGIILLLDGTLKVDDIIEVNGSIYRVLEINFRTTTVLGRDENYVILPNSQLTGNSVVNWTHSEISSRFKVTVGVDYATDVEKLMLLLKDIALKNKQILASPEPFVRFEDYADSALIFSLFFYTNEVFRSENLKSDLRIEIYKAFGLNNITFPFPQRVVHLKNPETKQDQL